MFIVLSDCRDSFNEVLNRPGMNGNFFYQPSGHKDVPGTSYSENYLTWRRYKIRSRKIQNETNFVP